MKQFHQYTLKYMTRIGFVSDLHLDSNQFGHPRLETLKEVLKREGDIFIGDLSNDLAHISLLALLKTCSKELPTLF